MVMTPSVLAQLVTPSGFAASWAGRHQSYSQGVWSLSSASGKTWGVGQGWRARGWVGAGCGTPPALCVHAQGTLTPECGSLLARPAQCGTGGADR